MSKLTTIQIFGPQLSSLNFEKYYNSSSSCCSVKLCSSCSQCAEGDGASPPADGLLSTVWRHQRPADRSGTSGAVRPSAGSTREVCRQGNIKEQFTSKVKFRHKVMWYLNTAPLCRIILSAVLSLLYYRWRSGGWRSWDWPSMLSGRLEATAEATRENSPLPSPSSALRLLYSWWESNRFTNCWGGWTLENITC